MSPSPAFWMQYFRTVSFHEIESYRRAGLERILPAFSRINEEAEPVVEAEFERLRAMPADPEGRIDIADLAEQAQEHGQMFYATMHGLRQGLHNLLAVGLHHLFEQQQLFFFQRQLATKENEVFHITRFNNRLAECGIDSNDFRRAAAKTDELRVAANAIKHGAGRSANELAELRPDLFEDPILAKVHADIGLPKNEQRARERARARAAALVAPLAGDGLYVAEHDLTAWCDAARAYWLALATILEEEQQPRQGQTEGTVVAEEKDGAESRRACEHEAGQNQTEAP